MKNITFIKTNMMLAAALLTAGVIMSYKVAEEKAAETVYYYNSNDVSEGAFATVGNWSSSISPSCLTSGNRPCKMVVPDGTSLSDQIGGKTNDEVLDIHPDERRP
ncbi:hypothetical protein OK344_09525 [Kaistella sp. BT6-1-3]|uniref:Secreted protein n=1 Tax=Kaistella yananensis TaxID=2989820 RepID=A0ABT3JNW5_9FLAO|nr:hypothetical protein [Kaistella yananensis]MCW4452448.1 hypothetical protein [Kaistella yananensis]